jgi:predicted nucleic acid-binding protein
MPLDGSLRREADEMGARAIIDASVVLASLLEDEPSHGPARELLRRFLLPADKLELLSTTLLPYELTNGLWQAVRSGRVAAEDVEALLAQFELFGIPLHGVRPASILSLAKALQYPSAYDVAYLALAESEQAPS